MPDHPVLRLVFDGSPDPFLAAALPLVEQVCGVQFAEDPSVPVLYHGNNPDRPCLLRLPRVEAYAESDIPGLDASAVLADEGPFPFDPFTALRFWLADEGNAGAPAQAWDVHDRLVPGAAVQSRLGVLDVPVANTYLLALRRWLEARLGVPLRNRLLPPGRKAVVVLSHDVDNPFDPGDASHFLALARLGLANGRPLPALRQAYYAARAALHRPRHRGDRHWVFDDVVAAEARHGFASTFFFSGVSPVSPTGHVLDVLYDIRQSALNPVFRRLVAAGAEIGLHAAYNAREAEGRVAAEKAAVEAAAGVPMVGNRFHYWHMRRPFWDSLAELARAGLRYDSSVAFNDAPGYRLGVALPFHPWHPGTGEIISCLQIPVMTMDSALCEPAGATVESAVATFSRLLDGLKRCEGVAAVDWHVRTSYPGSRQYSRWGKTYLALLEVLAADREVAVRRAKDLCP